MGRTAGLVGSDPASWVRNCSASHGFYQPFANCYRCFSASQSIMSPSSRESKHGCCRRGFFGKEQNHCDHHSGGAIDDAVHRLLGSEQLIGRLERIVGQLISAIELHGGSPRRQRTERSTSQRPGWTRWTRWTRWVRWKQRRAKSRRAAWLLVDGRHGRLQRGRR